jgi:hypothetical protein
VPSTNRFIRSSTAAKESLPQESHGEGRFHTARVNRVTRAVSARRPLVT